jgi:hypothetical protein
MKKLKEETETFIVLVPRRDASPPVCARSRHRVVDKAEKVESSILTEYVSMLRAVKTTQRKAEKSRPAETGQRRSRVWRSLQGAYLTGTQRASDATRSPPTDDPTIIGNFTFSWVMGTLHGAKHIS